MHQRKEAIPVTDFSQCVTEEASLNSLLYLNFSFAEFLGWTKLTHQPHPGARQWHHELPRRFHSLHQNHGIRQTAFLGRNWGFSISNSRILRHDRLPKHNPQHHSWVSQGQEYDMNMNMSRITLFHEK